MQLCHRYQLQCCQWPTFHILMQTKLFEDTVMIHQTLKKFTIVDTFNKKWPFFVFFLLFANSKYQREFSSSKWPFCPITEWKTQAVTSTRNFQLKRKCYAKYECLHSITIFMFNVLSHHFQVGWTLTMVEQKKSFLFCWLDYRIMKVGWIKKILFNVGKVTLAWDHIPHKSKTKLTYMKEFSTAMHIRKKNLTNILVLRITFKYLK